MMLLTFNEAEPYANILAWRADPQVGLEARRLELIHEGWDRQSAETAIRWQLAYRKSWVAKCEGREDTAGVTVSLAEVKAQMAAYQPYPRKVI